MDFYGYEPPKKKKRGGGGLKYVSIALIFLIIGASAAIVFYQTRGNSAPAAATATASPAPEATTAAGADNPGKDAATATLPPRSDTNTAQPEDTNAPDATTAPQTGGNPAIGEGATPVQFTSEKGPVVDIARDVSPSVVGVSNKVRQFNRQSGFEDRTAATGSGVVISSDGYILTNNHVVSDATKLTVTLADGTEVDAVLVGKDSYTDIAVIRIEQATRPVVIGKSSAVEVGEMAVAIGNPLGNELYGTVTVGYISGINRSINVGDRKMTMIQTDAAINAGNSGGALLNMKGELIGINTLKSGSSGNLFSDEPIVEGLGFAIPIDEAMPIVQELIKNGKIPRPGLGIYGDTVSEEVARFNNVPQGVLVTNVLEGSAAEEAGLKAENDIITKIDGEEITEYSQLIEMLRGKKIGDEIEITVYRIDSRRTVTLKATLQELTD